MASTRIYKLKIGAEEADIYRKRIKHIHLVLCPPDGRIRISAPFHVDDSTLVAFVLSKTSWITKRRASLAALQSQQAPRELQYVSGEKHLYRGKTYLLNVIHHEWQPRVEMREDRYIDVYIHADATKEQRRKVLTEWYRRQLKQLLPALIEKWQPIIDVDVKAWGVKQMKTRWGTCNISAQRIWLNLELIKKPLTCLEYVVVHEMVHLLERHHNARFKAYMNEFLPSWREHKFALNYC
ncbi:MAG: M48 family metallopeptidase [Gammaproteobacteria bacterium]|nr:M48 family metallopeptidase [Gammaproteobacteria bacterium]